MKLPVDVRDEAVSAYRQLVCQKHDFVPFPHQAEWWLASDGLVLGDEQEPGGYAVRLPDMSLEHRQTSARPLGRARVLADLGAFKIGKSKSAAMWACGFAAVPNGRVSLVGIEYDICEPEFNYICEALLGDYGMGWQPDSLQNRPRDGKMWLDLPNGCRFEAKSWERKDTLKGKEVDAYIFCEAFMLPDISCYTGVKQNLAARHGYAVFPTTPDRPWVQIFHKNGHGKEPDWHCTCSVPRTCNPETFNQAAMDQDDPARGGLMTREKFAIAYLGRLGDFVGRVYNYQRGDVSSQFTPQSHPALWADPKGPAILANLRVPDGWTVMGAADTGTFMSGVLVAFDPDGHAYVLYEQPNYRYVAEGEPELDATSSIPGWAMQMRAAMTALGCHGLWADRNSQFKAELRNNHDIVLLPASTNLQTRTEVAREYFQAKRIHLAPWLEILPYELESACWPEEASLSGRFERLKIKDHSLDGLEHILAKRPIARQILASTPGTWAESVGLKRKGAKVYNPHLGSA